MSVACKARTLPILLSLWLFPLPRLCMHTPCHSSVTTSAHADAHRVPEDAQKSSLEEDAELCEGAGGKAVSLNRVHFLGQESSQVSISSQHTQDRKSPAPPQPRVGELCYKRISALSLGPEI